MARRYARAHQDYDGVWKVLVSDEHGWCYMCRYDEERIDWVTCTFGTQEQAEKAAEKYNDFWKEA